MSNIFNTVMMTRPKRSRFNNSHHHTLSFQMGTLVPHFVMDVVPGDYHEISTEALLRFAPLVSPVMHRVRVTQHFYFVPNRIIWPEWERWITGQSDAEAPYFKLGQGEDIVNIPIKSLGDHMGLPTGEYEQTSEKINALPFAAYAKIFDEYYRDQNLQIEQFVELNAGDNLTYATYAEAPPLRRAWQHDYFTSCLPTAQDGSAVQIPLVVEDDIPVDFNALPSAADGIPKWRNPYSGTTVADGAVSAVSGEVRSSTTTRTAYDPDGTLTVDVQAGATTINTLRRAFRLQEWLERNIRGGKRYIEHILSHFGVMSSDKRLQRPEYLGGSVQNMVISEVLSTAENSDAQLPIGTLAGHGISVGASGQIRCKVEEHGYIIGLINVQPDTAYFQGIPRHFSRLDKLDYLWPTFANIGEQEVKVKELYGTASAGGEVTFGYIPRYSEYRYMPSRISGSMRSNLDFWHLARKFASPPALNEDFIKCNPDTRIFAFEDPTADHILSQVFFTIFSNRPLPKFGVPTI